MSDTSEHDVNAWPQIPLESWSDSHATLHLWLQIVGKVRLTLSPWVNHSWNATYYVTSRGLTTSPIPYQTRVFQIDFNFVSHHLEVRTGEGDRGGFQLRPQTVAAFYNQLMDELARMRLPVKIHGSPNEVSEPIPFAQDNVHASYDAEAVAKYWRALVQADRVFKDFRARFIGKASPVHYYWGAPDLAVARFSGRTAPQHPGGVPNLPDRISREAYSHEVSSCGFWAGGGAIAYPAFYAYAYPEPDGFSDRDIHPADAFYSTDFGEFILPYDAVRESPDPDQTLLGFLQATYEAAADAGGWDRGALERTHDPRHAV